jgi:hypothetical protein
MQGCAAAERPGGDGGAAVEEPRDAGIGCYANRSSTTRHHRAVTRNDEQQGQGRANQESAFQGTDSR